MANEETKTVEAPEKATAESTAPATEQAQPENDPNALSLATSTPDGIPSVRMVLLKGYNEDGFIFYTNFNSKKGIDLKKNPNASMCFHWKSLRRQIRISGKVKLYDL